MSATTYAKAVFGCGAILFACAIAFESFDRAHAGSFDVCASGCVFKTIQSAVNAADDAATITVAPGVYHETVTIDRPLTILGPQHDAPATRATSAMAEAVVTGVPGRNGDQAAFVVAGPHVTINGVTVGPDLSLPGSSVTGIRLIAKSAQASVISTIIRNATYGLEAHWTDGLSIEGVRFDANVIGLYAAHVSNVRVGTVAPVPFSAAAGSYGAVFEWVQHLHIGALTMDGVETELSFNTVDDVTYDGATYEHIDARTLNVATPSVSITAGPPQLASVAQAQVAPASPVSAPVTPTPTSSTASVASATNTVPPLLPETGRGAPGWLFGTIGAMGITGTGLFGTSIRLLQRRY